MRKIVLAALAVLVLCPYAIAQDATRVTMTAQAQPVTKLIEALGQKVGHDLRAHESLKNEIVCLRVTDVPLEELLKKLASATSSEWKTKDGALVLSPSAELRNKDRISDREHIESRVRSAPTRRVIAGIDAAIVNALPIAEIARMEPGTTMVFAISPTQVQSRLNRRVLDSLSPAWLSRTVENDNKLSATDVQLVVRYSGNAVRMKLRGVAADGTEVRSREWIAILEQDVPPNVEQQAPGAPLQLTGFEQAAARVYQDISIAAALERGAEVWSRYLVAAEFRESITEKLRDPVENEPLAFFVSPLLLRTADSLDLDFLAVLPDSAMDLANIIGKFPPLTDQVVMHLFDNRMTRMEIDGGWTVLIPHSKVSARQSRLDRRDLKEMVAGIEDSGGLSPFDCFKWLPDVQPRENDMVYGHLSYFDSSSALIVSVSRRSKFWLYRFLAALPRTAFDRVSLDGEVVVQNLSPLARKEAWNYLTSPGSTLSVLPVEGQIQNVPPIQPTDVLDQRLRGVRVRISQTSSLRLRARNLDRSMFMTGSIASLAKVRTQSQPDNVSARDAGLYAADEFLPVHYRNWKITFEFPNGLAKQDTLGWSDSAGVKDWVKLEDFPPAFKKAYQEAYEKAKKGGGIS